MGEEKLIVEQSAQRREGGGYLEKLAKAIFPPVSRPIPQAKVEIGRMESSAKLKKLESEHLAKISIYTMKINRLNEDREKLKSAIEILKELNLDVPEEYNLKKRSMQEEVEALEKEVEREKMLLNYLQSKILPLIR
ncbi:MAG: hypothetical protein QXJ68_02980 [Methanocellales archaeon]